MADVLTSRDGTVALEFNADSYETNKATYLSTDSIPQKREMLQCYRSPAKVNGNSLGRKKSTFKLTFDREVPAVDGTTRVEPQIIEVSASLSSGLSVEDATELTYVVGNLLTRSAFTPPLRDKLQIIFSD